MHAQASAGEAALTNFLAGGLFVLLILLTFVALVPAADDALPLHPREIRAVFPLFR